MATYNTTRRTGPEQMPGIGDGQSSKSISVSYDFTTALAVGDVLKGPLIQSGSVITDVLVIANGIGTATIGVGESTLPTRFVAGGTGPVIRSNVATARPFAVTRNATVDITIAGAATSAAGSLDLTVFFVPRNT